MCLCSLSVSLPSTDSHHLVRPCRNNIFSKDKFLLSFLCTGIIIIIIIIINIRKCLLLPKKIFSLVHNIYSNSKAVSSEGWSVGYKGFLYYSWTSSATQAGSLFYWDNSFFFPLKPVFSITHFISADSAITWSLPFLSLSNIKWVGISPSLSIWIIWKGFV